MTNYERIKNMSVEEMITCINICPMEIESEYCKKADCDACRKQWLKRKVTEE